MTQADELLTPPEAAEVLRVVVRTLDDWRYRGVGPRYVKLSHRAVRYRASDVYAWIAARERTSTSG
jgi:predicted DNA-binding transcriptional regulator AlpA